MRLSTAPPYSRQILDRRLMGAISRFAAVFGRRRQPEPTLTGDNATPVWASVAAQHFLLTDLRTKTHRGGPARSLIRKRSLVPGAYDRLQIRVRTASARLLPSSPRVGPNEFRGFAPLFLATMLSTLANSLDTTRRCDISPPVCL